MKLDDAMNLFALRLYEWAKRDLLRELQNGCQLLSLIALHHRPIGAFIEWNKTLSPNEREEFVAAYTLLAHQNVRELKGLKISEREKYWNRQYYEQTTAYLDRYPPLESANRNSPSYRPLDVDFLIGCLADRAPRSLGRVGRKKSAVTCTHKIGDWKIKTEFKFERRRENLYSTFQFVRKDDTSKLPTPEIGPAPFPRSLLAMYGIYNRTVVIVPSESDVEPMADAMLRLTDHFVSQSEPLFEGLGVDD